MSIADLLQEARTFERSSSYRYGDRLGFSIRLSDEILLKGASSPGAYLDLLGLAQLPERVMIVGPGNGGLATECFRRGAKRVICVEVRMRFQATLRRTLKLQEQFWAAEEIKGLSYRVVTEWQQVRDNDGFRDVDLILWPEGVSEITRPKEVFATLKTALKPGGTLKVEICYGRHKWVEQINSWRPSEHAIADMSEEIFGGGWLDKQVGRSGQTSTIVTLGTVVKKATKKKKKKKKVSKAKDLPPPVTDPSDEPIVILGEISDEPAVPATPPKKAVKKATKKKPKKKKVTKKTVTPVVPELPKESKPPTLET